MPTISWSQLSQTVLSAGAVEVYAAAVGVQTTIQAATAWNPTGSPVTVEVWVGSSAVDATRIGNDQVPAGQTAILYDILNHKVPPGAGIFAQGNGCTLTLSGAIQQ